MTPSTFTIIAHRALLFGPDRAAENTMSAITAALAEQFPVEFDITIDARGERLVLSHDVAPWTAEREPRDLLDLPAPPSPHALNVKDLCALPEILDLVERHAARSAVFLFDFELVASGRREARYLMRSVQERGFAVAHRVSEREPFAREYASDPSVSTIWLDEFERDTLQEADVRLLADAGKRCLYVSPDLHRPETPAALRERWLEVMSWGVHGICTDYPIALRSVLEGATST
jgi:glycerophosphoryl diester phosphodiesterase